MHARLRLPGRGAHSPTTDSTGQPPLTSRRSAAGSAATFVVSCTGLASGAFAIALASGAIATGAAAVVAYLVQLAAQYARALLGDGPRCAPPPPKKKQILCPPGPPVAAAARPHCRHCR